MSWKDFARFMTSTFNTMPSIDDPNEDADDNVKHILKWIF